MYSYTVTIGRNTSTSNPEFTSPLSDDHWAAFNAEVREYFWGIAESWKGDELPDPVVEVHSGIGYWEGTAEESTKVTLLSEGTMNGGEYQRTVKFLDNLAAKYNQDAIAFTFGTSTLIGPRA